MGHTTEFREVIILTPVRIEEKNTCKSYYYNMNNVVASGHKYDPCNICKDYYIFKKSIRLERRIK